MEPLAERIMPLMRILPVDPSAPETYSAVPGMNARLAPLATSKSPRMMLKLSCPKPELLSMPSASKVSFFDCGLAGSTGR